jgi:hypothetical protein
MESQREPGLIRIVGYITDKLCPVGVINFKEDGMALDVDGLLLFEEDQGASFDNLIVITIGSGAGIEVEVMIFFMRPMVLWDNFGANKQMRPKDLIQVLLFVPGI